ncbi:hypothetical protein, partial [Nocardioides albidus]|uniref:hypothetical protein n=1 Tax=Nocardioides albidus TaxID=1517589 RepID=UPI001EFF983B
MPSTKASNRAQASRPSAASLDFGVDPGSLLLAQVAGRVGDMTRMRHPHGAGLDAGPQSGEAQHEVDGVGDQPARAVGAGLDPGPERGRGVLGDQRRPHPAGPLRTGPAASILG